MDPESLICGACGAKLRTSDPQRWRGLPCPACLRSRIAAPHRSPISGWLFLGSLALLLAAMTLPAAMARLDDAPSLQTTGRKPPPRPISVLSPSRTPLPPLPEPVTITPSPTAVGLIPPPPPHPVETPRVPAVLDSAEPRRVRVGDEFGRPIVARVYGGPDSRVVMLPDGQLGWPNALIPTNEPFRVASADTIRDDLLGGPYRGFKSLRTTHYVIIYDGSTEFARNSGTLLESLYRGLMKSFGDHEIEVHEAEFPLVAIIFRTEADFRAHRQVDPNIQAYYEISTNRISFYESNPADHVAPEVAVLRRPQTVAHEGTHQILNNIGVQPRMAHWPLWLVEGLAEYAAPITTRKGEWAGFNKVNPFHMATIHDLENSLALQGQQPRLSRSRVGRVPERSMVESLVTREHLDPTDYALSWALTHYLANKRFDAFVAYLKTMSHMPPGQEQTPQTQLQAFRDAFGPDLPGIDKAVHRHLSSLKNFEPIPYYAVVFEQAIGRNRTRRGTLVSQSSLVIRQWIDEMQAEHGTPYQWHIEPFATRRLATQAVEQWINGR